MREILFRGKNEDNGEWVEGYYSVIIDDYSGVEECSIFPFQDTRINGDGAVDNYCFVVPETVGQYTGLTDKNGRKIFEGDIVKKDYHCTDGKVFQVKYDAGCACFVTSCEHNGAIIDTIFDNDGQHTEILGNVYDNPELLNKRPKQKEIWANALLSDGEILFWHTGHERASVNHFYKDFIYAGYGDKYAEAHKLELVKKKFEVDEDDICANNRVFEVDARNFYRQFRISPDCKGNKPY